MPGGARLAARSPAARLRGRGDLDPLWQHCQRREAERQFVPREQAIPASACGLRHEGRPSCDVLGSMLPRAPGRLQRLREEFAARPCIEAQLAGDSPFARNIEKIDFDPMEVPRDSTVGRHCGKFVAKHNRLARFT